ncbi:MAG: T9SS type A sorting domain-containing protein [Sediminibacterium sp.]|nr:T9SS type A sorting domain-containing protein [Sediminibacterium sp.]
MLKNKFLVIAFLNIACLKSGFSQWNSNTTINTDVVTAVNTQKNISISSDTKRGAILVWEDKRNSTSDDVYAQRVNSAGLKKWVINGVAVCTNPAEQNSISSVEDGNGGVIIAWDDYRNGDADIYAQRLDSNGVAQWTSDGIAVCNKSLHQKGTKLISDGQGGAIIVWQDSVAGATDIYAQRISGTGAVLWANSGVPVCAAPLKQIRPRIQSDNAGGAFIVWQDRRSGLDYDVYVQRINSSGNVLWAANGIAVCNAVNTQSYPKLRGDGAGGIIIAWQDKRNALDTDLYAQRVDANGNTVWQANGLPVCVAADNQEELDMTNEGLANGVIVSWTDHRSIISNNSDVYIQKIDLAGTPQWPLNGVALTSSLLDQKNSNVVGDGSGGAIVVWQDSVAGNQWDIRTQRVNTNGVPQWALNGIPVCNQISSQTQPGSISNGAGGCIYAWEDKRNGIDDDIYVHHSPFPTLFNPEFDFQQDALRLFPIPVTTSALLSYKGDETINFTNGLLRFTSITGNETKIRYSITNDGFEIFKDDTPAGIYFYTLILEDRIFTGKMIVGK